MRYALVARRPTPTNAALSAVAVDGDVWEEMLPEAALDTLRSGDTALGRLDVLASLDGVEDGLWALGALAARGVLVLNEASALLAAHDKLLTSRLLRRAGVPHPVTAHVRPARRLPSLRPPVVLKPRFGSWGRAVVRCDDERSLSDALDAVAETPWFRRHGAIVQHLVPPVGFDLRVIVASGRVVGAIRREAAPGEWRTNVSLGATRKPVDELQPAPQAVAVAAAAATGASLAGVDLMPCNTGWTVLEVNGAVEFTEEYRPDRDIFAESAAELIRAARDTHSGVTALATA